MFIFMIDFCYVEHQHKMINDRYVRHGDIPNYPWNCLIWWRMFCLERSPFPARIDHVLVHHPRCPFDSIVFILKFFNFITLWFHQKLNTPFDNKSSIVSPRSLTIISLQPRYTTLPQNLSFDFSLLGWYLWKLQNEIVFTNEVCRKGKINAYGSAFFFFLVILIW